ncbi:MAG: ChbG/HpnK family deacetylase [Chitinophagaceae bacterium]|nr:ChbG/HpnK family deacetylase [Chitinophagaceae bacterium]
MKKTFFLLPAFFLLVSTDNVPKPPRLIVRGDDMGYSHSGNEAIIKCYKDGIESSIEIIVASPWFPEAVKMLEENPGIDVGIHLALTSEWDNIKWRPISDCPSLKDADGYFFPMVSPNKNYPGRSIKENKWTLADVEKEWRAQIEMALKKIPRISHISSHMGCTELNDSTKWLINKLTKEYKIDIDPFQRGVKYIGYAGPHKTPEDKIESFIKMLDQLKADSTYIFVDHPGLNSAELQAVHHIGYENVATDRQGVTDTWTNEKVKAFIRKKGIQIISYKDLLKKE